jgi:hypothetical protein
MSPMSGNRMVKLRRGRPHRVAVGVHESRQDHCAFEIDQFGGFVPERKNVLILAYGNDPVPGHRDGFYNGKSFVHRDNPSVVQN